MPPRDATEEKYLERVCERTWAEREIAEVEQHCLFEMRAMGSQRATVDPAKYVDTALRERLIEEMTSHDDLRSQIAALEEKLEEENGQHEHDMGLLRGIKVLLIELVDDHAELSSTAHEIERGTMSFADLASEILDHIKEHGTKRQCELETECAELKTGSPVAAPPKKDDRALREATARATRLTDELQKVRALADQAQSAARSSEERLAPAMEEIARLRTELETARGLVLQVQEASAAPTKKPRAPRAPKAPKVPKELPLWDMFVELSASQGAGK